MATASLHILIPPATAMRRLAALGPPEPLVAVRQAYAGLGFVAAGEAPATRSAVLTAAAVGEYASLYDSAEFGRDPALPRQLAATISKRLGTTAIVTRLLDAERFEFILYRCGRQVDAAVSEAEMANAGLTHVRGRRQATLWYEALGHHRFMALTEPAAAPPERIARFMAQAGAAAIACRGDAATALGAWCQLAQLPHAMALRGFDDAAGPGTQILALAEPARRPAGRAAKARLTPYVSTAEYPQQGFFPAAWPVPKRATTPLVWPVLLQDGGLSRLRVAFHMDRAGDFRLEKVSIFAFSFRNEAILSAVPLASWGQLVPQGIGGEEADIILDADPLVLLPPSEGTDYLLQIRADIAAGEAGELFITASVRADSISTPALMLPALRLAITPIAWVPHGADPHDPSPRRHEALLRLNAPSVHSAVAILADTGDDVREAARAFLERFLQPITTTSLIATVETQKHITPEFSVPKSCQTVPMQGLLQMPAWDRLFQAERGFQSVRIGIGTPDSHALAGMVLQTSLRNERGEDLGQTRFSGPSLTVAFWVLAEEAALAMLRMDMRDAGAAFAEWVREQAPLQAWAVDCAWVPEFDQYDHFVMTPYEAAGKVEWFRDNLAGMLTDRAWLRRHLRFVAPRLWLGWELAERVDARALTGFAQVTQMEDGLEILLRDPIDLPMLEHLLAPILPAAA